MVGGIIKISKIFAPKLTDKSSRSVSSKKGYIEGGSIYCKSKDRFAPTIARKQFRINWRGDEAGSLTKYLQILKFVGVLGSLGKDGS